MNKVYVADSSVLLVLFVLLPLSCSSSQQQSDTGGDYDLSSGGEAGDRLSGDQDTLFLPDNNTTVGDSDSSDASDDDMIVDDADQSDEDIQTDGVSDTDEIPDTDGLTKDGMGPGSVNPYEPNAGNADSVEVNDKGELKLERDTTASKLRYLWVSNSADGTISKIDTFTQKEVARYYSGVTVDSNPSRTTVDLVGDMFVGNRNDSSVTKIAGSLDRCVDRNHNGVIDTSSGPDDILPRDATSGKSTDECVLWTRVLDDSDLKPGYVCKGIRGMAATPETGESFSFNGHLWVGCFIGDPYSYKLNGKTGDIMDIRYMKDDDGHWCDAYGFVLDKDQKLWISCRTWEPYQPGTTPGLAWMDVKPGAVDTKLHYVNNPENPDLGPYGTYGIAIDNKGRLWNTKLSYDASTNGFVFRYTPSGSSLIDGVWDSLRVAEDPQRGIAADDDGYIWVTTTAVTSSTPPVPQKAILIDGDTFPDPSSVLAIQSFSDGTHTPYQGTGIAVDFNGNVWGISRCEEHQGFASFMKIDRSGAHPVIDTASIKDIPIGNGPYVYSDMIGYNLRNFASIEGWYRQTFEVCHGALSSTIWKKIYWDADIPVDTKMIIRARTAEDKATLDHAPWVTIVSVPTDSSPNDIPTSALPKGHFIQLEVRLYSREWSVTPTVGLIHFDYKCSLQS